MANNINCTCGHSWSKASSSKKDMYVCHICGKDNTMKDGGWLDNYGKKPNPNDVEVSTGPGFVGMGNDTTGRNYSPAWGGQFEDGGNVAQKGIAVPTTADSARLFNAQMALNNFYAKEMKAGRIKQEGVETILPSKQFIPPNALQQLNKDNLDFYRKQIAERNKDKSGTDDEYYKSLFNLSPEKVRDLENKGLGQTKASSEYQQYYRDLITPMQNLAAPFALLDSRITPQRRLYYESTSYVYPGGDVMVYDYDPLAIKPYYARTDKEKLEWEKKYGKGTPITSSTKKPITSTEKSKTEPVKQSSKKEPVITNNPKDPRLKAYQDSLQVYNSSKFVKEHPLTGNYIPGKEDVKQMNINIDKKNINKYKPKLETTNTGYYYDYKKPVQPVEYKKLEEIEPTQFTPKGSKKYIVNGMEVSEEDFLGSGAPTGGGKRVIYNTPNKGTQKVLRLDGTPETDPDKIRRALATANKKEEFQMGGSILGRTFLQPNNPKLPVGWNPIEKGYSTEYSTTIGKDGEYYLVPGFKHGKLVSDPEKEFYGTGELLGGPFKTIQSAQDFADRRHKYVEQGKPIPSPIKTYDYLKFAMGGSLPGAVGFTYARVAGSAPSNGKYAKKTKASAQNGKEMKFYQEGLDFKPNSIAQDGEAIVDPMGQWAHPGEVTIIPATDITMEGVDYPVLGISDTGDQQMMYPGEDYDFDGEYVTEYPMMKEGGWLSKYQDGGGGLSRSNLAMMATLTKDI